MHPGVNCSCPGPLEHAWTARELRLLRHSSLIGACSEPCELVTTHHAGLSEPRPCRRPAGAAGEPPTQVRALAAALLLHEHPRPTNSAMHLRAAAAAPFQPPARRCCRRRSTRSPPAFAAGAPPAGRLPAWPRCSAGARAPPRRARRSWRRRSSSASSRRWVLGGRSSGQACWRAGARRRLGVLQPSGPTARSLCCLPASGFPGCSRHRQAGSVTRPAAACTLAVGATRCWRGGATTAGRRRWWSGARRCPSTCATPRWVLAPAGRRRCSCASSTPPGHREPLLPAAPLPPPHVPLPAPLEGGASRTPLAPSAGLWLR